ncbi:hypothetical protein ACFLZ1_03830 [Patescibacteria group bacterium]
MSLPFVTHALFLALAVILSFVWVQNPHLSIYTLQLIAVFILLFFVSSRLKIEKQKQNLVGQLMSSTIFTMVVLLLVLSTGGLGSPLFFLVYFLLFGLSLILEPINTIFLSTILIIIFTISNPVSVFDNLIPLFSLLLITPLSLFFGRQYLKVLSLKGKVKILKKKETKTKKDIIHEETNTLLWLSLNFKYDLQTITDLIAQALEKPGLSFSQKENLVKALKKARKLSQSGQILEEKIDRQTD